MSTIDRLRAAGKKVKGFKPNGVRPEVRIADKDVTGMDSLARVEYTIAVEEELGIALPDEKLDSIETFGDLARLIDECLAKV